MTPTKSLLTLCALFFLSSAGCKNKDGKEQPATKPVAATPVGKTEKPGPPNPNNPPTFEVPAYEKVGVGQEIGFGLEVIDEESDVFAIELIAKPASATFDHPTLTVVWTPTKADMPAGEFAVRISEKRRDNGDARSFVHYFSIAVAASKQPLPEAQPLGSAVETLITIHDPERLAQVNKDWPIDVLLEKAAKSSYADLDEAKRKDLVVADRKALYESFLTQLSKGHQNKTVDPTSPTFDAKTWADPKDWKIIALRPRLDKKWHELRIVYKAKAHAATYAMFKFRPFAAHAAEKKALAENNKVMAELTLKSFFKDDGTLDPALMKDKNAHAARAGEYMNAIVNYDSTGKAWPSATFLGLPMEARLGGGTKRDKDGNYESGDAWGWHVMKVKPTDGVLNFKNIPIKGFATKVVPAKDNKSWQMACSAAFAAGKPTASLCRKSGHVDLPATGDGYTPVELSDAVAGKVVSSLVDAANMHYDYKDEAMVSELDLHDPRRDLFEEKGMTCAQCHVRKFGVRDMYDRAAYDPSAGEPKALNKKQNTTYFVITPTERWQPYALDFQYKQECKIKAAIERATGKKTSLTCPLRADL